MFTKAQAAIESHEVHKSAATGLLRGITVENNDSNNGDYDSWASAAVKTW